MNYTAIDFETGNAYYTSACSIGVSVFEENEPVRQYVRLIRPPESVGAFHWYNIKIHGIRRSMVAHEPDFAALWQELQPDIDGRILACHNAMFDTAVLRKCLEFYGLPLPHCRYICTVKVAQKLWPQLENHKLDTVSAALGIPLNHHEAGSDAHACGLILRQALVETGCDTVEALAAQLDIRLGEISPSACLPCSSAKSKTDRPRRSKYSSKERSL
jgi:DNA polymerase-3 subunit epsilon